MLIVDDDELDRYLLARDLARSGVESDAFECSDGVEALDFLRDYDANRRRHGDRFPPQVIFLDINMPRMNGLEFLAAFAELRRERPDYEQCTVIMVTSSDHPADRQQALAFDFVQDFVTKGTTDAEAFGATVRKSLAD